MSLLKAKQTRKIKETVEDARKDREGNRWKWGYWTRGGLLYNCPLYYASQFNIFDKVWNANVVLHHKKYIYAGFCTIS